MEESSYVFSSLLLFWDVSGILRHGLPEIGAFLISGACNVIDIFWSMHCQKHKVIREIQPCGLLCSFRKFLHTSTMRLPVNLRFLLLVHILDTFYKILTELTSNRT